ncbi:MAG: B12-binding domain-containing radical SAM protein [Chloroflexi bacterium]|nr:B12-binding domain-containing radical SAM protein [Chloroflexota bacterium]
MRVQEFLSKIREQKGKPALDVALIEVGNFYEINFSQFNVGLLYMAAVLKEKGFSVKCIANYDLFSLPLEKLAELFYQWKPALIGFYTISDTLYQIRYLAGKIKEWSPGSKIVLGGPLATLKAGEFLKDPLFDFVIRGEGEYSLAELAGFVTRGEGDLHNIAGIAFREDGGIYESPEVALVGDLDLLPYPDYDQVGVRGSFSVVSGRGCPYRCIFCFKGAHGDTYRYRAPENVVGEIIDRLEKYDARAFGFIDDTFVAKLDRAKEISRLLKEYRDKSGKDFIYYCEGRADILSRHPEVIGELAESGMARIQLGLESGSPEVLKEYRKMITPDQMREVVKNCADHKISVFGNFILGGPHENEATFKESLELALELLETAPGLFECSVAFLCPYPGTEIQKDPGQFGIKILDTEYYTGITLRDCFTETENLTRADLWSQYRRFSEEIEKKMLKLAPEIPGDIIEKQFAWASKYGMSTSWHQYILSRNRLLSEYFQLVKSPRFRTLKNIPTGEIGDYFPMRTIEVRQYSEDGSALLLEEGFRKIEITDPRDIWLYEHCSGKLPLKEIGARMKENFTLDGSIDEIIEKQILATLSIWEDAYYMAFYR